MNNLQVNDFVVAMRGMTQEQLKQIQEEAKDRRLTNVEEVTKKQGRDITIIGKSVQDLTKKNEELEGTIIEIGKELDKFTKTFMTNGAEKRECEKYMHNLIYKVFEKDSLEDQLLHGYLTARCKAHLVNTFPDISKFESLRVDDIDVILKIIKSFLSPKNIKIIAKKRIVALHNEKEKRESKKIPLTYKKEKEYKFLETLLKEMDYDINNFMRNI